MASLQSLLHITDFGSPVLRNVVPTVATIFGIQTVFGAHGVRAHSEKYYDLSGGITFLVATSLGYFLPNLRARQHDLLAQPNWRQTVLSIAVGAYATRLSSYLFFRVLKKGGDSRFDATKHKPRRFFVFWIAQAVWVSLCLMPVMAVCAIPPETFRALPEILPTDALGLGLYAFGISYEMIADYQKSTWSDEKRRKVHDEDFITRGLFSRSRYPNYFGDITLWVGMATAAAGVLLTEPVQKALGWSGISGKVSAVLMSYVSPAFVAYVLLRLSGVPLSQRKYDKLYGHREDYRKWRDNTPMLFPKLF